MLRRLLGLTKGLGSDALTLLALLLGLLLEPGRSVVGGGTPKDRRFEIPVVSGSTPFERAEILLGLLRPERTVTEEGILVSLPTLLGEWRGDAVLEGGGSFDRTECTRSSIFCMRPIRPLI